MTVVRKVLVIIVGSLVQYSAGER